jgi:5,10-methylenetetrahydromethanopterin reductase
MRPPVEFWLAGIAGRAGKTTRLARRAETEGWDGICIVDSQNLNEDPYVHMALAAAATSTLGVATGVTNCLTRHPAVAATTVSTVHAESGGRAVLGIGRGDSSLAHLGLAPASPAAFERYLVRLQGYLRGDEVPFDVGLDGAGVAPPSSGLGMATAPDKSRIKWLERILTSDGPGKVPVEVVASGPKVIGVASRQADRIMFAVGASPKRIAWAIDEARAAVEAEGRKFESLKLGAYLPMVVREDRAEARSLISGGIGSYARFSVMHGTVTGPVAESGRQSLEALHDAYDMNEHFRHDSPQSRVLSEEVIDEFGIAGSIGYCIDRLTELLDLGLTKVCIVGGGRGGDREAALESFHDITASVLPKVRTATAQ